MASAPDSMWLGQRRNTNTLHPDQTFSMNLLPSHAFNGTNLGNTDQDGLSRTPSPTPEETDVETLSSWLLRGSGVSLDDESRHDEDNSPVARPEQPKHSATDSATTTPGAHEDARKPKHITRRGPSRYLHGWIVHVPAVIVTIVVIIIGKMEIYWYPEIGPVIGSSYRLDPEIISNVLQLAAKIHECLIVASLSSIALAMFRRRLITDGVRLGFLTGSYRVGDLGYLGRPAFWRQGLDVLEPWEILLSGFLVFSTLMSTIVGPASAVLIIPTLGWWDFRPGTAFENIELPIRYLGHRDSVWTKTYAVTEDLRGYECHTLNGTLTPHCPGGGFAGISKWVQNYDGSELRSNLTFSATSADIRRHVDFTQSNFSNDTAYVTISTTPPQCVLDSIGLLHHYIKDITDGPVGAVSYEPRYSLTTIPEQVPSLVQLYQPFVQSRCRVYNMTLESQLAYPKEDFQCFNDPDCEERIKNPPPYDKTPTESDDLRDRSVVLNYGPDRDNSPVIYLSGLMPNTSHTTEGEQPSILYLCAQMANWVSSNFSADPAVSDVLHSTLSDGKRMQEIYQNRSGIAHDVRPIHFNMSWSKYVNPTWKTTESTNVTYLSSLAPSFVLKVIGNSDTVARYTALSDTTNTTAIEVFLAKVFGGYLTDAIARSSFNHKKIVKLNNTSSELNFVDLRQQYGVESGKHTFTRQDENSILDKWTTGEQVFSHISLEDHLEFLDKNALPINIEARRYGYGSGQGQERRTGRWAQTMLYIYLGVVAVYAATIAVGNALGHLKGGEGVGVQSVIPWTDLQELFVLGLRSPPPREHDLTDAGAGVSSTRVWQKVIAARADDGDNVQLGFKETPSARLDLTRLDLTGKKKYF
ncbi:hypothetical protein CTA2_7378 [Colletotrichum tanaceti]|uniref:Uncharacterized protein n=1 Tax=Colletotrichum tanaceti TaxID=1306861 RepID=A0A4V6DGA0_9PEZI|nr:hypothetical protein CTA2_7378 [Colletotrichum tanaceti]TKW51676.1 hypothetical protein CTA1_2819 [Colletotrichum tanaceti]